MGICLHCVTLSDANIQQLLNDPPLIWRVLEPEDESAYLDALAEAGRPSFIGRLFGKKQTAAKPRHLDFGGHELHRVDLDKSWDGIAFCLRALRGTAGDFFTNGTPIGAIDVGYGPALAQMSTATATLASALRPISSADMLRTSRSISFADAYLASVWSRQDAESEGYLLDYWEHFRVFVLEAAEHEQGIVLHFS